MKRKMTTTTSTLTLVIVISNHISRRLLCSLMLWSCLSSITLVHSKTDSAHVSALNVMYTSLNSPSQLNGWKSSGGDPCSQDWDGIKCSGSAVTEIKLSGLGLTGSMGYQLSSLTSVNYFDLSDNKLTGDIPYQLPPNVQHLDLSGNRLTGGVPYSISQMKDLEYLNLGHNQLKGELNDMFGQLSKLTELDLSFNSMSGKLPQSFVSLSNLNKLKLQNNIFSGSINVLADLPLDDLNVANNKFTGWIPDELKNIDHLKTDGNSWSSGPAPPPPPGQKSKSHAGKHSKKDADKSGLAGATIAGIVIGILVVLGIIVTVFSRRSSSPPSHFLEEDKLSKRRPFTPLSSQELSNDTCIDMHNDFREIKLSELSSTMQRSPSTLLKPLPSGPLNSSCDNEIWDRLKVKRSLSIHAVCYSLADLQVATGNFATGRLLGEGSIGRIYKAKYGDGKVLAVKKIDSSLFQSWRDGEFTEVISNISKLRHPNLAELVGYCSEQGQNMLIYDYFRNGSLHDYLHLSDDFSKPLTWNTRVKIALGTARAIEYLHEVCSPPCLHKNIKSSNIFLDIELSPRLSDCGLAMFHQHTSQNLGPGYSAPECTKLSAYTLKSDVYSFGVVMLELLTGRLPFDSSKPRSEQSLVRWAAPQLHDIDSLTNMVDPGLRGLYPPKSVSRFADIISLCIQEEPEFRQPMSEVVQALVRLVQRSSMNRRAEDFEY